MTTATHIAADQGVQAQCRFAVLGPLVAHDDTGRPVDLGSPKMRAVLTLLLAENRRVVSVDTLVAALWGDDPPPSATGTLQVHISHLRRLLEPDRTGPSLIVTSTPGYRIDADPGDIDLWVLPTLVADAGRLLEEGDPATALDLAERAVGLWRGEPLTDLGESPDAVAERVRLADLHVLARERRATALTQVGRPDEAVAELERLLADHPLRERLWMRMVEALYASGRQAEALEACRTCTRTLRDELGIDPSAELRELQQAVLRQDPALSRVPAPVAAQQRGVTAQTDADATRPLVGRRSETARLQALLAETAKGDGATLVVEGEAGIGKTRLAEAASSLAEAAGWRTAWARCADDAGAPGLWACAQAMAALGGGAMVMPEGNDADQRRFSLFQQVRSRLAAASADAPVLLVLDDVQSADATSLGLLGLLGRHLAGLPVLMILTVRTVGEELPEALVECLAALAREPRSQRLMLSGLAEGDVRDLVASQLSGDRADDLAAQVYARTEGNPFFVVELLELLRSEQRLEASALPLPPSVRDVLERRLSRLPTETVSLLQLAALAGRDVELALLQSASALSAEVVLARLEPAVLSGLLIDNPVDWQWRFSHALVQETLLAGLGRLPAARLHAQLAGALEGGSAGPAEVERLAHHYFRAVPITGNEPARRYATAAAAAARQRLAHEEAAAHTRRALTLLGSGDDAERQDLLVALGDDLLRSGRLLEAQAVVAEAIAVARTLGDHDRLAEAASVWGGVTLWNWRPYGYVDPDMVTMLEELVAHAAGGDPALRARLLGAFGVELAYGGRRFEGVGYAEQAVALSREIGDPELLGRTLNNYSLAAWGSPVLLTQRMDATDEALALAERGLPARTQFFARLQRGPMRLHLGDRDGFEADLAEAIRLAQQLTGPEVMPHVFVQQTGRAVLMGAYDEAEELSLRAFELLQQTSLWGANVCWALQQFTLRRHDGNVDDALAMLVENNYGSPMLQSMAILLAAEGGDLAEARRLRRRWPPARPEDWTTDLVGVVEGWLALAMDGDVRQSYDELLPYSGRLIVVGTATSYWGSYDALLARLAEACGDGPAAAVHWKSAIALCERVGAAEVPLLRQSLALVKPGSPG